MSEALEEAKRELREAIAATRESLARLRLETREQPVPGEVVSDDAQ